VLLQVSLSEALRLTQQGADAVWERIEDLIPPSIGPDVPDDDE
jgi:hypothetical protein